MSIRVVQLSHRNEGPHVAVVDERANHLVLVQSRFPALYIVAVQAVLAQESLSELIIANLTSRRIDYEAVWHGQSEWRLLPPFEHPVPSCLFVTGTGLTHKASAENRQSMHGDVAQMTDSMKMYRIGLEGGRPAPGTIGAPPEWFYKGTGHIVRAHGEPLDVPNHGDDGGDEAEIAGVYLIGPDGTPHRVGLVQGNEFSDHVLEARNYLYLAQSKLRSCSLGPEIVIGGDLSREVRGEARIERHGETTWSGPLASGEPWMCHTLANLEHHHFKHDAHRRPGDAHVHFFGADLFSFKDRLRLEDGDVMVVAFDGFGRPLRNPIRVDRSEPRAVQVKVL